MPLGDMLPFREAAFSRKYPFTSFMIAEARSKAQSSSFQIDFKMMKVEYAAFMEQHLSKMDNFYSDWDVNAVKGLLQTGRFSKYSDDILDELINGRGIRGDFDAATGRMNNRFGFNCTKPMMRHNIVGVVAPPCAGKSTTVEANMHRTDCLVLDGSWLIGTASRQLLGRYQDEKFQFGASYGEHTRTKHILMIEDLFPAVLYRVNEWLDIFENELYQNCNGLEKCTEARQYPNVVLIFHSNPKVFQFLKVPIYSTIYCEKKEVLKTHVAQRHTTQPPGWIDIRLDWFYQCNIQATAALDNMPLIFTEDLVVQNVSSNKELEITMEMYPENVCRQFDNQDQQADLDESLSIRRVDNARKILIEIMSGARQ